VPDADAERFTALYEAHFARVWAYVAGRVGRQAADEVTSETFAVAWRRQGEIPDAVLPWLLGVARNVSRGAVRGTARRGRLAERLRSRPPAAAPDVADAVVERAAVLRALATLSDGDREVLTLVAWHGLAAPAAAAALDCSRAAFAVRLHRARRRLERALREVDEARLPGGPHLLIEEREGSR
jgi:RNA polymerase sigma-70 factor (ECF subfamily)